MIYGQKTLREGGKNADMRGRKGMRRLTHVGRVLVKDDESLDLEGLEVHPVFIGLLMEVI
jgi:hypothetical protein